jgi:hypothetical protein
MHVFGQPSFYSAWQRSSLHLLHLAAIREAVAAFGGLEEPGRNGDVTNQLLEGVCSISDNLSIVGQG